MYSIHVVVAFFKQNVTFSDRNSLVVFWFIFFIGFGTALPVCVLCIVSGPIYFRVQVHFHAARLRLRARHVVPCCHTASLLGHLPSISSLGEHDGCRRIVPLAIVQDEFRPQPNDVYHVRQMLSRDPAQGIAKPSVVLQHDWLQFLTICFFMYIYICMCMCLFVILFSCMNICAGMVCWSTCTCCHGRWPCSPNTFR